jgi:hypothetical protein
MACRVIFKGAVTTLGRCFRKAISLRKGRLTTAKLIYSAIASLHGSVADESGNFHRAAPDGETHAFGNDLEQPDCTPPILSYWARFSRRAARAFSMRRRRVSGVLAWSMGNTRACWRL